MAKVDLSLVLDAASGKAGNVVFYKGRTGQCLRARVQTPQPRTPAQIAARRAMSEAAKAWRDLSIEDAEKWNTYAKTLPHNPTGNTAFIALTTKFLQIQAGITAQPTPPNLNSKLQTPLSKLPQGPNSSTPQRPPQTPFTPPAVQITATRMQAGVLFHLDQGALGPDCLAELLLQPLPSPHRKPEPHRYKSMAFTDFSTNPIQVPLDPTTPAYSAAIRLTRPSTGEATELRAIQLD